VARTAEEAPLGGLPYRLERGKALGNVIGGLVGLPTFSPEDIAKYTARVQSAQQQVATGSPVPPRAPKASPIDLTTSFTPDVLSGLSQRTQNVLAPGLAPYPTVLR
jgi:hypothetical protein